jgi:hypothetical protein
LLHWIQCRWKMGKSSCVQSYLITNATENSPPADNAFHVSQLHIILGRTDALLEGFATGLTSGAYDLGSPEYVARYSDHDATQMTLHI